MSQQTLAKLSAIYSGLVFGVYWIPLRALNDAGFSGIWATVIFNLVSAAIVLPVILYHWRRFIFGRIRFHLICLASGVGFTLYASAFVYTEVVSVIVLFYLMPIWGFLLARWFIGDLITPVRWFSMVLGFAGLMVILDKGVGLPIPQNIGDWMALIAGLMWAGLSLMLLTEKQPEKSINYAAGFIFWGCVSSFVCALIATRYGFEPAPVWDNFVPQLKWLFPFALIVIVPAAVATIYAPTKLNPGVVGLLFMTEISVGTATAAFFAGEPFGMRQILGVSLITLAGVLEGAYTFYLSKSAKGQIYSD